MRRSILLIVSFFLSSCGEEPAESDLDPGPDETPPPNCGGEERSFSCDQEFSAATQRSLYTFGVETIHHADYQVSGVGEDVVSFDSEEGYSFSLRWPGKLPVEIEPGEKMSYEARENWFIMSFAKGDLALILEPQEVLTAEFRLLDGSGTIFAKDGCYWDPYLAFRLEVQRGDQELILEPGDKWTIGDWNYHFLYATEPGELVCIQGKYTWLRGGDTVGRVAFTAYRKLEP